MLVSGFSSPLKARPHWRLFVDFDHDASPDGT